MLLPDRFIAEWNNVKYNVVIIFYREHAVYNNALRMAVNKKTQTQVDALWRQLVPVPQGIR